MGTPPFVVTNGLPLFVARDILSRYPPLKVDGSESWVAPSMSLKMTYFLQSSALVSPHFFSQHQAAFLGHRWRNSRGCAIYVGIPSLILAKWRKLSWASKGRDALKPNFNKWPEEPFLPSRNGSSGHLLKFGFKASRPLLAKWRKLRHRCPKKGHRWRNSFSRYCNAIVIFSIYFCQNMLKN